MHFQPQPSRPTCSVPPPARAVASPAPRRAAWALAAAVALASMPLAADGPTLPGTGGSRQAVPWPAPDLAGPGGGETSAAKAAWAPRFELAFEAVPEGLRPRGVLFRAAPGVRLGALGGIDEDGGGVRALIALRLDF
jgi:hypothetical protein